MRSPYWLSSSLLLIACGASDVQSQRLKDGSWSFTCDLPMDECVHKVQTKCEKQRFRILSGTSETRLRDAPPYEQQYHTSRLHLVCTNDGDTVLLSLDGKQASAAPAEKAVAAVCLRGQTRECVGAGACRGGQICLQDGTGFGSCDCGPVAPSPAPAAPDSSTPPAPASEPASAPASTAPSAPSQ
jgi:hypothetical protein